MAKKNILLFLFVLLSKCLPAQIVFTVDDFSPEYYGKISVEDTSEVFMKGWVAIYDKKTGKQIIKVTSDELAFHHHGGVKSNIKELPYGEQSVIMYDDYNFDGVRDFAIQDGQNSYYHLPSFRIYLAKAGKFIFNKSFTKLAQENTGMFGVDSLEKKLYTMNKSGCCWHQFSDYTVSSNKPKLVRVLVEDANGMPFITHIETIWHRSKKKMKVVEYLSSDTEYIDTKLSFELANKKRLRVFVPNGSSILYCVLTDTNNVVEWRYPISNEADVYKFNHEKLTFHNSKKLKTIKFTYYDDSYTIYESVDAVGITVKANNKEHELKGILSSKKGTIGELDRIQLDNVVIE